MGNYAPVAAVADSGPIIHLNEIGQLRLLAVFSVVHYPDAVWRELVDSQRVSADVLASDTNVRHDISATMMNQIRLEPGVKALHDGEIEAIALCRELSIGLLLTDDLAARTAAQKLGIRPVGSLGIVVRAAVDGRIDFAEAEECLHQLHRVSSLFVTGAIVDLAVQQLRQHMKN